ncbi:ariadne-2 isoform X2 [Brachionus plicatilis]|uniref:Ariadne-2 isoform X2 n=1 Tax=Brachionus plicatilis TaxID=10195 RepID=A0A3M7RPH1_BRAPC|nr:ariadne-2 isoform X2 [Brachionus plicatilis]
MSNNGSLANQHQNDRTLIYLAKIIINLNVSDSNNSAQNNEGGTLVDWEFLIEAVDVLTRARYTLQYTYLYAYFFYNNQTKMLSENIQAELKI